MAERTSTKQGDRLPIAEYGSDFQIFSLPCGTPAQGVLLISCTGA